MDNRLNKYYFKPLPNCNKEAAKWIQDHPMDCIVWAAQQCNRDDNERSTVGSEHVTGLTKQDKVAIMSINLEEDLGESVISEDVVHESSEQVQSSEDEAENDEVLELLQMAYNGCTHNIGKKKMIECLLNQRKKTNQKNKCLLREAKERSHERRINTLREMGVDETMVNLLPASPTAPVPDELQEEIDKCQAEKKRKETEKETKRHDAIFETPWLHKSEKELARLQLEFELCPEGEQKKAKHYILTTYSDALKAFHRQQNTSKDKGLELRRKMCIQMGLLKESNALLVRSLYEPLPVYSDSDGDDSDEDCLFYTPKTPSYRPTTDEPTYTIPESPGFGTPNHSQTSRKRKANKQSSSSRIDSYFRKIN